MIVLTESRYICTTSLILPWSAKGKPKLAEKVRLQKKPILLALNFSNSTSSQTYSTYVDCDNYCVSHLNTNPG
jgi:hypothetical protein